PTIRRRRSQSSRIPTVRRATSRMASRSRPAPAPEHVLALFGPTASGKSAVAGVLRERLGAEGISADSPALYADLPVLTAAPEYPSRLVGVVPLEDEVSVGDYQRLAPPARAHGRPTPRRRARGSSEGGRTPLVVGGPGLYLRAALSSLELPPPPSPAERSFWQAEYD